MHWDDENEIGERVWMGLEIENVEKALWVTTGVTKLTLVEAESESLVQLRLNLPLKVGREAYHRCPYVLHT